MTSFTIRFFDLLFALLGLFVGFPLFVFVFIIGYYDTGSPVFIQERVGRNKKLFMLIKFRTMPVGTASIATHFVSQSSVTSFGRILRKTKLDELPQLINVLRGDMSLVGPRPCLLSQVELIKERQKRGVLKVLPGITGLGQVNKIDMSTPRLLAETDAQMIKTMNLKHYFAYILKTILGKGSGDRVKKQL